MRAAALDAVSSDKFGDLRQAAAGASESVAAPRDRRAGVAEVHVVLVVLAAFWGRCGGWAPLGVHPSCGSLCWGGGRRSPWAAFSGRCWITLQRAASATGVPAPPSVPHFHSAYLRGSWVARGRYSFFPPGLGAPMCKEGQQGSLGAQTAD